MNKKYKAYHSWLEWYRERNGVISDCGTISVKSKRPIRSNIIQLDEITDLKILLNTTNDVDKFVEAL